MEIYAGTSPGEGTGIQGPGEAESRAVSAVLGDVCASLFAGERRGLPARALLPEA